MRHAKSDWTTSAASDFDRPLAKRGRKDAPRMGTWLAEHGLIPDLVVSSPALRARQTTLAVADKLGIDESEITWEPRIYETGLRDLLEVLHECTARTDNLMMLVGHNPGLDSLVEYLADSPPTYRAGKLMTTAAVAVLDFGAGGMAPKKNGARLELLIRPKDL